VKIELRRESDVPLYRQVAVQIRDLIRQGALAPAMRLPTVRALATELGLSRLTVHSAYAELHSQGLIEGIVGRGTFVSAQLPRTPIDTHGAHEPQAPAPWLVRGVLAELAELAQRRELISFAQAIPAPESYPLREFRRALSNVLDDRTAYGYGAIQGDLALRAEMSRLLLERGIVTAPENILITSGAQQGIAVTLAALAHPGEVVLVEEPTYPGFIELAAQRGQRLVGIPRDADGLSVDAIVAACKAHRPRLLYTVPTFHNPTGAVIAPARQAALLKVAAEHDLLLVEDDIYGFQTFDGPPPLPLRATGGEERVIYITSFSKALMPGLRLGAVVAAPHLLPDLAGEKHDLDLHCSPLLQRALANYLRHGAFASHLQSTRELYRTRRDALLAALECYLPECTWTVPAGGLSLWVTLPESLVEREYYFEALDHGVGFARGQAFFPQPQSLGHMRLSFGGLSPQQIEEGVRRLAGALNALQHRRLEAVRVTRDRLPLV
jgi:DNA-binding transcriptional MocR family regulator